jgi:serine/threonine protein kinase
LSNEDKTRISGANRDEDEKPLLSLVSDPLIGTTFADKYEVMSLLGEGGMSKVYKARHKFMKRIVALKILHEEVTRDPTARARFQQEAEAASLLNHQNVVTVFDFGFTPNGQAFFVMDCLEGQSLAEILEAQGSIPVGEALDIFAQGCDGLDHAHRKGIIHRDIKPSNLVIIKQEDGSNLVKLVDFGIAKLLAPPDGERERQRLTLAGEVFGTPAYMSPEQCSGGTLDARSDIYSFGCLMYEALSGEPPLLGETLIATITKHISEKPRTLGEAVAHASIPSHIDAVILKCLEKKPEDRYASASELKQALFDAAYASGIKGLRVGAVAEPKSAFTVAVNPAQKVSLAEKKVTQKWRVKLIISLSVLVGVLGTVVVWLFFFPGPEGDSGPVFDKILWQFKQAKADELMNEKRYSEAIELMKQAANISAKFGDDHKRLENTLNKLGQAYGQANMFVEQEAVNKRIALIADEHVNKEADTLIQMLKEWESPAASTALREQRALQAAAFADRIAVCADKQGFRSKKKQEELLKKAISVFDAMELQDWKSRVRFRTRLGECYRQQQRFDEENNILLEARKLCPENPSSEEGWKVKIQNELLYGQYLRNLCITTADLDKARTLLEGALKDAREHLKHDNDTLRNALNSVAIVEELYRTKEHNAMAARYKDEAKSLDN